MLALSTFLSLPVSLSLSRYPAQQKKDLGPAPHLSSGREAGGDPPADRRQPSYGRRRRGRLCVNQIMNTRVSTNHDFSVRMNSIFSSLKNSTHYSRTPG